MISYKHSPPKLLTVKMHSGTPRVRIFDGAQAVWLKVATELARAFYGADEYIFLDNDPTNAVLKNIIPIEDAKPESEVWVEGYEGRYSITKEGIVYSYLRNRRLSMKISGGRVNLLDGNKQNQLIIADLVWKYF